MIVNFKGNGGGKRLAGGKIQRLTTRAGRGEIGLSPDTNTPVTDGYSWNLGAERTSFRGKNLRLSSRNLAILVDLSGLQQVKANLHYMATQTCIVNEFLSPSGQEARGRTPC